MNNINKIQVIHSTTPPNMQWKGQGYWLDQHLSSTSHISFIGEQDWFYPIKQDSGFALALSQIQARIENLFKQHLNFKQDLRI